MFVEIIYFDRFRQKVSLFNDKADDDHVDDDDDDNNKIT